MTTCSSLAGPAQKTGLVQPNDVLYEVDGKNVYRSPLSTVSSNLLGANESVVRVVFLRNAEQVWYAWVIHTSATNFFLSLTCGTLRLLVQAETVGTICRCRLILCVRRFQI